MPNTPALIGEGMTGVSFNASDFSFDERDVIDKFLLHLEKLFMLMKTYGWSCVCKRQFTGICIYVH